jgi:hypothetical protein
MNDDVASIIRQALDSGRETCNAAALGGHLEVRRCRFNR